MFKNNFIVILMLVACRCATAQSDDPINYSKVTEDHVSVADISDLDDPGKTFIAATLINGSVGKVCGAIMDYTHYPQFMPNTDKVEIVSSSEDATVIAMTLKLPLGKIKKYRLKMTSTVTSDSCHLAWKLVPWEELQPSETITDTSGFWQLAPDPKDSSRTLVRYHVYADPGPIPYGFGWIVDMMTRISLPRTLEALRERVVTQ